VTLKNSVGNFVWNAYCDVVLKICLVKLLMNVDFWNFRFYISLTVVDDSDTSFAQKILLCGFSFVLSGRFIYNGPLLYWACFIIYSGHYYIEHSLYVLGIRVIDLHSVLLVIWGIFKAFIVCVEI
jgi:hypothetical protein